MLTEYIVLLKLGNKLEMWSKIFQNGLSSLTKDSFFQLTHSKQWAQRHFFVDLLRFLYPLPPWMKHGTRTKSLDLAFARSVSQMMDLISQFYLRF